MHVIKLRKKSPPEKCREILGDNVVSVGHDSEGIYIITNEQVDSIKLTQLLNAFPKFKKVKTSRSAKTLLTQQTQTITVTNLPPFDFSKVGKMEKPKEKEES